MSRNIAIITARGGSKRIPKKNIKSFCGKPIIAYSIEAAKKSGIFDEIMVSTDSREIAEIAETYGASVPFFRSERTSDDFATTADVLKEVILRYEQDGQQFDSMCCIYPTAPFVTPERLRMGMQILSDRGASEVKPVVRYSYPPQRAFVISDGCLVMGRKEYRTARSQDLQPVYHDAGQFYCINVKRFLQTGGAYEEDIYPLILTEMEVQDIDTEEDWEIAELKYTIANEQRRQKAEN